MWTNKLGILEFDTALIDADVLLYQAAFKTEIKWIDGEYLGNLKEAKKALNESIDKMADYLKALDVQLYISDPNGTFRHKLNPNYKSNRKNNRKPEVLKELKQYLIEDLDAKWLPNLEADDAIGVMYSQYNNAGEGTNIMCSIDKDFRQIQGIHYDWMHNDLFVVYPVQGYKYFMRQVLMGDAIDGYHGVPGIGPKKSEALVEDFSDNKYRPVYMEKSWAEYFELMWKALIVPAYYNKGLSEQDALLNARMAFLLRDQWYDFDTGEIKLWEPTVKQIEQQLEEVIGLSEIEEILDGECEEGLR
jgi:DNA polymerase-1